MTAYHHLLYNILRKSKRDGCPVMPAGHIHLGRDTVALPVHRKRHTCVVPGSGHRGPPLPERSWGQIPLWAEIHSLPCPALPSTDGTWVLK